MLDNYKVLLWDFDGVIMDSMPVRSRGFAEVLRQYPSQQVDELLAYHHLNGGLSRYVKFRYFFEKIREEKITEERIMQLANDFSGIMLSLLINKALLIPDSVAFIKANASRFQMHIVSGSDQTELRKICDALSLAKYFITINGSPTPKNQMVKQVLLANNYEKKGVALIGDSINDYDAAVQNVIDFWGYNNDAIKNLSGNYIEYFSINNHV